MIFFNMMQRIGKAIDQSTSVFTLRAAIGHASILDLCMAPGGMLLYALQSNPGARATAFTLPVQNGGHAMMLSEDVRQRVSTKLCDITLLAADMGVTVIPEDHPDRDGFILEQQLMEAQVFDVVICDGQVLRLHTRARYREVREARRMITTQLVLGLKHVKAGGRLSSDFPLASLRDTD